MPATSAKLPRRKLIRRFDTHRLIPARYSDGDASVLTRIADDPQHLQDIFDLDHATNDRLLGENDLLPGIGIDELVVGVPYYRIVNAAFCHAHPLGSRFNGPQRGAWYAAFQLATAQAEVAFHKSVELAEVSWFDEEIIYDDYLADFSAEFCDLRNDPRFSACLAPATYVASQKLAEHLMAEPDAMGIVYPSVRRTGGVCLVCFRPALVMNVRRAPRSYRLRWRGRPTPEIRAVRRRG